MIDQNAPVAVSEYAMPADSSLFERLQPLLDPVDPAELHGLLCSLLSLDAKLDCGRWLDCARQALAGGDEWPEGVADLLAKLLEFGTAQMNAPDWPVTPLLPDDDTPLRQRVDALSHWCDGLLYGLGTGELQLQSVLSKESWEFLEDVTNIARVGFGTGEASESDEVAYMEVVEYLRVGLLMVQQDIQRATAPIPPRLH